MMLLTPASSLFLSVMVASTLMAMTSSNWLLAWIAMEINLLSFVPIMSSNKSNQETEACVKYFLAQAMGSALMILASMSLLTITSMTMWWNSILILSLLLKLGAAPCHYWFPMVMTSLPWPQALLLTTWQKLAPLSLLCFSCLTLNPFSKTLITISAILNALLGGIMGMNQSHIRTLLAYSSITHMGWMISTMQINNPELSMTYFLLYTVVIVPMFILLHLLNISQTTQLLKLMIYSKSTLISLIILLLSLGGLPPLTGFLPKWMVIMSLMSSSNMCLAALLIGSFMNLYFYMNLTFNMLSSLTQSSTSIVPDSKTSFPVLLLPATSGLGFIMMLIYAMTLLH